MNNEEQFQILKGLIESALGRFYNDDSMLFDYKTENRAVCERSMVFRIGIYLNEAIENDDFLRIFNLDNEYNRNFNHPKGMFREGLERIEETHTYPDLIVHKRKSNEENLLVMEFKKGKPNTTDLLHDIEKLEYFTNKYKEYKYRYGFYIELHKKYANIKVFEKGEVMGNKCFKFTNKI